MSAIAEFIGGPMDGDEELVPMEMSEGPDGRPRAFVPCEIGVERESTGVECDGVYRRESARFLTPYVPGGPEPDIRLTFRWVPGVPFTQEPGELPSPEWDRTQ